MIRAADAEAIYELLGFAIRDMPRSMEWLQGLSDGGEVDADAVASACARIGAELGMDPLVDRGDFTT